MKKILIILAVLIVLGGGIYLYQRTAKLAKAPVNEDLTAQNTGIGQASGTQEQAGTSTQGSQPATTPSKSTQQTKTSVGTYSSGEGGESTGPDVQVWEVDYSGQGFNPSTIDVKLGDIVIFKNKSTVSFWPISSSTDYPDFNAGKSIAAGGRFQFQFTKAGQFGYHDKLNPSATGTVKVSR